MLFIYFLLSNAQAVPIGERDLHDLGTFWQVSDFHLDKNYSIDGIRSSNCHSADEGSNEPKLGKFGDRKCDAPWLLATSAVEAMTQFKSDPDFILWTGDSSPHVPDAELNVEKMYGTVSNITGLLRNAFPDVPIYPTMGNHDAYPANQITDNRSYYEGFLNKCAWGELIPEDSQETFLKGGYFSTEIQPGLSLIVLNTNMYLIFDKLSTAEKDPGGQFQWLEETLAAKREAKRKAYVVGHVPPGVSPDLWKWMYPDMNTRLADIMRRYHDVIVGGIFAHEHTDTFRIIYDENDTPTLPIIIAPPILGAEGANPSIRLYTYNRSSGLIISYRQYALSLSLDPSPSYTTQNWSLQYSTDQSYNVNDLSALSLQTIVNSFTTPLNQGFQDYVSHYSTNLKSRPGCGLLCWRHHICSICNVQYDAFDHCLNTVVAQHNNEEIREGKKTQILSLDSDYDILSNDKESAKALGKAIENDSNDGDRHFDWDAITDNGVDIFGNPVEDEPPCPNGNTRCQNKYQYTGPRTFRHAAPSYMYVVVYAIVGLLVFSVVLVTILCCFWPRHKMFSNEPRYVAVKTSDAMETFDNTENTIGFY